jgi:hypothetical protein
MSALSIQPPFPIFTGIDGQPLENGYVWIGVANLDPEGNQIAVYWDEALTIPAPQPIRTVSGYPARAGSPARLYVDSDYSIRVQDKNGTLVYSAPVATERYSNVVVIGDNAEDVIYDPPFTNAAQTNVKLKLSQTVSVKDFGAVGDGITNDAAAIQAAIDEVSASGGGLVTVNGSTLINSTITIRNGVVLDFQWTLLTTTSDVDLIYVNQGGQLKNCRINVEGLSAYSKTAVKFVPLSNVQGDRFIPWVSGLAIRFATNAINAGTGVEIDGDIHYVQLTSAENISVRYGGKAIYLHGTGGLRYVNGNVFNGVVVMDSHYSFYLNQHANGNVFDGVVIERNTQATIYCDGSQNNWQGIAWDQVPIVVSGAGNNFGVIQTTRYGAQITDTGIDNRSYSRAVEQFGNVSTNSLNDYRQGLYELGRLEFRDFFLGSLDSRWTSTLAGNGAITFNTATFGAATNNKQFSPYMRLSGTGSLNGEVTLNFNGNNIVTVVQKPIIHVTNYTNNADARLTWRVGLWEDANNHIYATQDLNLYGDDDIRLVCSSGGVSTTQSIATAAFERISFMTLNCSTTGVTLNVGQYRNTATSAEGQVARGINKIFTDGLTTTITTNIPTTALEPYIYMAGNNNSPAFVDFLDFQLIASRKAAV